MLTMAPIESRLQGLNPVAAEVPDERADEGAGAHLDVRAHVAAVRVPTLVVHRTADGITPVEHGRWLADHIPGARLRELPGADHLWWLPDPFEVADLITDFTEEHSR